MASIKRRGGEVVERGDYFSLEDGEHVRFEDGGRLPGGQDTVYLRLHPLLMLLLSPILGLAFAVFLPFIGLAMAIHTLGKKLVGTLMEGFWEASSFGWRPSEAYLLGRKTEEEDQSRDEGEAGGDTGPPAAGDDPSEAER